MHSRSQWVRRWQQWHWHPSVVLCLDNNLQLALQELQTLDNGEELRGIFKILNKNKRLAKQSVRAQPVSSWNSTVQTLRQLFLLLRKSSLLPPRPAVDLQCCWPRLPWGWLWFLCPCHLRLHMRAFPIEHNQVFSRGNIPSPRAGSTHPEPAASMRSQVLPLLPAVLNLVLQLPLEFH